MNKYSPQTLIRALEAFKLLASTRLALLVARKWHYLEELRRKYVIGNGWVLRIQKPMPGLVSLLNQNIVLSYFSAPCLPAAMMIMG